MRKRARKVKPHHKKKIIPAEPPGRDKEKLIELWEYVGPGGADTFLDWYRTLPPALRAGLKVRIDLLRQHPIQTSIDLKIIVGPIKEGAKKYAHIYKLQYSKERALRPLLCRGPFDGENELTFLVGAEERDGRITPSPTVAQDRREKLLADHSLRRRLSTEGALRNGPDQTRIN